MSKVRAARTEEENKGVFVAAAGESAVEHAPEWAKPYAAKLTVAVGYVVKGVDYASPYVSKAVALGEAGYKWLEPYGPDELLPMFVGVLMVLFGGYFMLTIACVEAYRIAGWSKTKEQLMVVWNNYRRLRDESDKDNAVDADKDGVADVLQISKKELVSRKFSLFLRSCDPIQLSDAFSGLYGGFLAVVSTLKLQFARTLALGVAIGDVISPPILRALHPVAVGVVKPEYHGWIDVVIRYLCKGIGVWVAMLLQRVLAAIHSALRGAQLFCSAFASYTAKRGYADLSTGYYDEVAIALVAVAGIYMQITTAFSMPWLLAFPLLPVLTVERVLQSFVAYAPSA